MTLNYIWMLSFFQVIQHTWLRLQVETVGGRRDNDKNGWIIYKGYSQDFTLFSVMCVNLQKIQDNNITICKIIIITLVSLDQTGSIFSQLNNQISLINFSICNRCSQGLLFHRVFGRTYMVDVKALPFFSNWKERWRDRGHWCSQQDHTLPAQYQCSTQPWQTGSSIYPGFMSSLS